ncbi:MAG: tyrosine-type recombinase/integrase [Sphingomonadales bacterium]|nr:tyrosine-type recombinase/integrase [Sphingomonadales bacterium]
MRNLVFTDHVKPLILLSLNTGCRRGELFDLTWANVNLDRRLLTVTGATAKSRRTRHIPLNREATSVLLNWRAESEDTSGLVFVNEQGERFDRANSSWRRLLRMRTSRIPLARHAPPFRLAPGHGRGRSQHHPRTARP